MRKISVIMPVYNAEDTLRRAIHSFRSQTLKEIELICVDDGSTDRSLQILNAFAEKDPRIRILSQENAGAGKARNAALEIAQGEFLSFLDADDQYAGSRALETLYQLAAKYKADAAGGSLALLDQGIRKEGKIGGVDYTFEKERLISFEDLQQAFYYQRFIISRSILKKKQIRFPDYRKFQDPVFFVKAMTACRRIAVTKRPTYLYTIPDADKYAAFSRAAANDFLQGHIDLLRISKEKGYDRLFAWCKDRLLNNRIVKQVIQNAISDDNKEMAERLNTIKMLLADPENRREKKTARFDIYSSGSVYKNKEEILELCRKIRPKRQIEAAKAQPLVSIIIPVYNVEDYIDTAIESVSGQSYRNLEIICVNDGSTDRSLSILNEWKQKDDRIVIIRQSNKGLSAARNAGLHAAGGKYIRFLDGDDAIPADSVATLVNYAEETKADMISFDGKAIYEDYSIAFQKPEYIHYYDNRTAADGVRSGKDILASQVRNDSYRTNVGLLFFLRAFLADNALQFKEGVLHEDNLFTFAAMLKAQRCAYLDEIGLIRRIRKESIMTSRASNLNVYGYFVCYCEMKRIADRTELDPYQKHYVYALLKETLQTARRYYVYLNAEEKEKCRSSLTGELAYDFDVLVNDAGQEDMVRYYKKELETAHNSYNWIVGKSVLFIPKLLYYTFFNRPRNRALIPRIGKKHM